MTPDELLDLAARLSDAAKALHNDIALGTKEQWNAWQCLNDAASHCASAAAWLGIHDTRTARIG